MFFGSSTFWLYLPPWLLFCCCLGLYGLRSPWRISSVGRSLFILYAALVAVLSLVLLVQVVDLPGWLLITLRVATVCGVTVAGFGQLHNIVNLQKDARREQPPHPMRRASDYAPVDDPGRC